LERSLSVLLPVHNIQATLAGVLQEFLEVLPELTRDFEVVVVDDGSSDATIEVADELATYYPQVMALRHATPLGRVAAIHTGLERSTGEVLLLKDEDCTLPIDEVPRLWQAMDEHEIVLGRPTTAQEGPWPAEGPPEPARGGLHMLSRRTIEPVLEFLTDQTTLLSALAKQGLPWCEVEVGDRGRPAGPLRRPAFLGHRPAATVQDVDGPTRADRPVGGIPRPKRANYMTKLSDAALEE